MDAKSLSQIVIGLELIAGGRKSPPFYFLACRSICSLTAPIAQNVWNIRRRLSIYGLILRFRKLTDEQLKQKKNGFKFHDGGRSRGICKT